MAWPATPAELEEVQRALAAAHPSPWRPPVRSPAVAGVFVCFPRGAAGAGGAGDPGWAGAALVREGREVATATAVGRAGAPYSAGHLALREGPLLQAALLALDAQPDVLLVNATGRDHPRRAGLALHLGAELGIASIGVTHRPLCAAGPWPAAARGAVSPLWLEGEQVGCWLRTRDGTRPLAVSAGWRTCLDVAVEVVLGVTSGARSPLPLRAARQRARAARALALGPTVASTASLV